MKISPSFAILVLCTVKNILEFLLQIMVTTGKQRFWFPKSSLEPPQCNALAVGYTIIVNCIRVFPRTCFPIIMSSHYWNADFHGFIHFQCACRLPNGEISFPVMDFIHLNATFFLSPPLPLPVLVELACKISSFSCPSHIMGFPSPPFQYPVSVR